jgi:hypothetical protein
MIQLISDKSRKEGKPLYIAFIDITKAYDNVRRPLLWRTLLERGFPQTIVNIMKSAYDDIERKVFWKGTVTEPIKNNKGLKQGSSLSGLKFNHYIAAVSAYLDAACEGVNIGRRKISHLMYADDIVITTRSREDMINALTALAEKLVEIGLTVNSQKSKIISQGPGTSKQQDWKVKMGEEQFLNISEANEIKYLGVWFGGGRAQAHSQHIVKDSIWKRQRLVAIAEQSHNKRLVLHALWTSSLKASMLSGISTIQITQQAVQALNTMQNKIAKSILGVSETTSTDAVLGILGWLPMDVEIKLRRIKQWVKMIASPPHTRSINRDILQYCRENRQVSVWYSDLVKSLKEFGVHQGNEDYPGDTKNTTKWVNHHVWKEWSKGCTRGKHPSRMQQARVSFSNQR